jgi:inhibitor of KinA sporulation pathway (predicted exonuclease)
MPSPKRDNTTINVIDVEATCWRTESERQGRPNEIIEVGIAQLDLQMLTVTRQAQIIVRPAETQVSEFCTELTGWTQQEIDQGITFEQACLRLVKEHNSKNRIWASWGDYDRKQFDREVERHNTRAKSNGTAAKLSSPFGPRHLNAKTLFMLAHNLPDELGTTEALALRGKQFQGRHHRGIDDAANIAGLLADVLRQMRARP